jgi:hypothetical protein
LNTRLQETFRAIKRCPRICRTAREHDEDVMQMNLGDHPPSDRVQRVPRRMSPRSAGISGRTGETKETTMFKTISAAVIAASLLVVPAMAGTAAIKTHKAPVAKHVVLKRSVANANAKMSKKAHHKLHVSYNRHHSSRKHIGARVTGKKVAAIKTVKPSLAKKG